MAHILVVDDEPASCELLVVLFSHYGHNVSVAHDGAEGLTLALNRPTDLIITDILMPALDGYALATRVRAEAALAHIQIIFYTAIDLGAEVRQLAAASGVAHIITKPAEPQTILAIVDHVLSSAPPMVLRTPASDLDHAYLRQLTATLHGNVEALKAEVQARTQAEAQLRAQTARLTLLADASRAFAMVGQDLTTALDLIVRTIAQALGDTCMLGLLPGDGAGPPVMAIYDDDPAACERMRTTCHALLLASDNAPYAQLALARAEPLLVSAADHAQVSHVDGLVYRQLLARLCVHSLMIAPLHVEDRVIGLLYLTRHRYAQPAYTADDLQLAQDLADRAALAIINVRLFTQLQNEIGERKQGELALRATTQQLQDLSRRLVAIQEAERRHLARELHDEIGQMLTGLNLLLETGSTFSHAALIGRLREAQAIITDLTARVRTLSLDLRPSMLDDLGLLPALLWHFERYTAQTQVHVVFKHRGLDQSLDPLIAIAVYRVVQEALTNVARYAQVAEASVAVWTQGHQVVLSIEDQGRGFDLEAALAARHSSGLAGMQERVLLLGGQMMVDTAPGQGTRVLVELPLSRMESRGD